MNTVIGIPLLLPMKKISGEGMGVGIYFKISYTLGKYCFLQFKQIPSVIWSYNTPIYRWDNEVNTIELFSLSSYSSSSLAPTSVF